MNRDARRVLEFWIGDAGVSPEAAERQDRMWFSGAPDTDEQIRRAFGVVIQDALAARCAMWSETARGKVALIIVLDQFTRNVYRGSESAYAGDAMALPLALALAQDGRATGLAPFERMFAYMPLQHSEDRTIQTLSIRCYDELVAEAAPIWHEHFEEVLRFARLHREIVERFGRFPHRNAVLGRPSTAAELDYLAANPGRFGQ